MITYDDSSLFLYPSGYKASVLFAQKPMDANGQLAFTRSNDTATRVDENLLIEKVRTNLFLQSNGFDTASWSKSGATVTANQPDPFGGNNAFLVQFGGATTDAIGQLVSMVSGTPYNLSVWIKGVDLTGLRVAIGANLVIVTSQVINGTWVRVSATQTVGSTGSLTNQIRAGNSSGQSFYIYGAQLETSDFGPTPYIPTVAAAVSVGPLANIPRIDYLGGGCGKLLLEPQRTNLVTFSEQFDNAAWTKFNSSVSANQVISPDGYLNADKLIPNTVAASHQINVSVTGAAHTLSIFAKAGEYSTLALFYTVHDGRAVFNLSNGTITETTGTVTSRIEDYGNGWYRCILSTTLTTHNAIRIYAINGTTWADVSTAGNGTSGIFIYGAQLEAGSYASSYVNTLAASVTRGADAALKENIAGTLPTAYPFTLFAEFEVTPASEGQALTFSNSALSNEYFSIDYSSGVYRALSRPSNTISLVSSTTAATVGMHKICGVFTSTTIKLFVDGALVASGVNAQAFNASINDIFVGQLRSVTDTGNRNSVKQALVFKSALSDTDAIALTT